MCSFCEDPTAGSRSSAQAILRHVFDLLGKPPASVADVGCGAGTWLRVALDLGTTRVRGFDCGSVQPADLEIPAACFTQCDLAAAMPDGLPRQGDENRPPNVPRPTLVRWRELSPRLGARL
jgi:hypothetical protein